MSKITHRSFLLSIILLGFLLGNGNYSWHSEGNQEFKTTNISSSAPFGPIEIVADNWLSIGIVSGTGEVGTPYIIENLVIDGQGSTGLEIYASSDHSLIRNCTIINATTGIRLEEVENCQIENITFINVTHEGLDGYDLFNCSFTEISYTKDDSYGDAFIVSEIVNCTIENVSSVEAYSGLRISNAQNCSITNISTTNCDYGINGNFLLNCSFTNLQISTVEDGIQFQHITNSTFSNLSIETHENAGMDLSTCINSSFTNIEAENCFWGIYTTDIYDTIFDNITIANSYSGLWLFNTQNINLTSITLEEMDFGGIDIQNSEEFYLSGIEVTGETMLAGCIYLESSSFGYISEATLNDSTFAGVKANLCNNLTLVDINMTNLHEGMRFDDSHNCTIINVTCVSSNSGINLFGNFNYVYNSNVQGTTNNYGLYLSGLNCSIIGNNISNNFRDGMGIEGSNFSIIGNMIVNNAYFGMAVFATADSTIFQNVVEYNGYEGILLYESTDCLISQNSLSYNDGFAVRIETCSRLNLTQNWIIDNDLGFIQYYGSNTDIFVNDNYLVDALTAEFSINSSRILTGQFLQFTDDSYGGSPDYIYTWDFGDGTFSSEANPIHQYFTPGEYTVLLTLEDSLDTMAEKSLQIVVEEDFDLIVDWTVENYTVIANEMIQLNTVLTSGNQPIVYSWSFISDLPNPSINFTAPGVYEIELNASDYDGDTMSVVKSITVLPDLIPIANFTIPKNSYLVGEVISFTETSVSGNLPLSYSWDFGDGSFSSDRNPTHTYNISGQFTITLTVYDIDGDLHSKTLQIFISDSDTSNTSTDQTTITSNTTDDTTNTTDDDGEGKSFNISGYSSSLSLLCVIFIAILLVTRKRRKGITERDLLPPQ